jgi:flagellar protein FlaF
MAYSSPAAPVRTARETEFEAIATITRSLKQAAANADTNFKALVGALHRNRQLWTILAGSVADPANELPEDLRARIFYLAEFTLHHTSEVLAGRADAGPLIDVNAAIMLGLRAKEKGR